jgi:hypothetical protein
MSIDQLIIQGASSNIVAIEHRLNNHPINIIELISQ